MLIHPKTKHQIDAIVARPSQPLGIFAPVGSGKEFLASHIAYRLLKLPKVHSVDQLYILRPNSAQSITIDMLRSLIQFLRLKPAHQNSHVARVIIVVDAHTMTIEAQNAFLKTLEEAPHDTVIILTATSQKMLLPTICSRIYKLTVTAPLQDEVVEYLAQNTDFSVSDIRRFVLMSEGRIGLALALLEDNNHPFATLVKKAKTFVNKSPYERLSSIEELSSYNLTEVFDAFYLIYNSIFHSQISQPKSPSVRRINKLRKYILTTQAHSYYAANHKLLLTDLMLKL